MDRYVLALPRPLQLEYNVCIERIWLDKEDKLTATRIWVACASVVLALALGLFALASVRVDAEEPRTTAEGFIADLALPHDIAVDRSSDGGIVSIIVPHDHP